MSQSNLIKSVATTAAVTGGLLVGFMTSATSFPIGLSQPTLAQTSPIPGTRALLVNLTTDDTWTANMAISLAHTALRQGNGQSVTIFLNVRGVYLADRNRLPATEGNSDRNIHQRLIAFIEDGGNVVACPGCSREAGLSQDDYINGVVIGEPGGILPLLLSPDTAVMSY